MQPVKSIELSNKHITLRLIATVAFLLIAAVAFTYGISSLFHVEEGWTEIEASTTAGISCSSEFTLYYNLGASGTSARTEKRSLVSIYSEAAAKAYRLFTPYEGFEDVSNIYYINRHPNEVIEIDSVLYAAFEQLDSRGDRSLYLGPAYAIYDNIFFCTEDYQLADFDPLLNEPLRELFSQIAFFARDEASIRLELLGDDRIRLYVSPEYLAFAESEELTTFIDFYWMKNAFIADYLAERLTAAGLTYGTISSYDGYFRNLDENGETEYGLNIYGRDGGTVDHAADMQYTGSISIVYLRDFMLSSLDSQHYYRLADGEIRTPYLSVADGLPYAAAPGLTAYSRSAGCAQTLLELIPIYIADKLNTDALLNLRGLGIDSIFVVGGIVYCTDPALALLVADAYGKTVLR